LRLIITKKSVQKVFKATDCQDFVIGLGPPTGPSKCWEREFWLGMDIQARKSQFGSPVLWIVGAGAVARSRQVFWPFFSNAANALPIPLNLDKFGSSSQRCSISIWMI
jgi:hypothetical protein